MPMLSFQHAGFILAFAGVLGMIFAEPIARLDAQLPWLGLLADEQFSRRMVDVSSGGCMAIGLVLLLGSGIF